MDDENIQEFDGDFSNMDEKKISRSKKKNKSGGFQTFGMYSKHFFRHRLLTVARPFFRFICPDFQSDHETWLQGSNTDSTKSMFDNG